MSVLEFIRKNSLLVLIVIAAVGVGLVMMDYSGKGSYFSRDYYIQVNGTGYSYPETASLGENGQQYIQSLYSSCTGKLREQFDVNGDDAMSDDEQAAMQAWVSQHPEYQQFMNFLSEMLSNWSYGYAKEGDINTAVNRAILHETAAELGIYPSKEQLDTYIRNMAVFRKADGSFDQALYQRLVGFHDGVSNNVQEEAFRSVVADMMVWECMQNLLTDGVHFQSKSVSDIIDALVQKVSGKTAWLPASAAPEPAEPTEEELKAWWEEHKDNYKTTERRIVSVYTLTPGEGSSIEGLMSTADMMMQDLSQANGKGFDRVLAAAAENGEYEPFTYLTADGKSHVTLPLCTMADAPELLQQKVDHNGSSVSLAEIAFKEVESAPGVAAYEAAAAAGTEDELCNITQVRGYFPTADGKLVFLRVEAAEPPTVLPFEEARTAALADLKKERTDKALEIAAQELFAKMEAALPEGGVDAAMKLAADAGAEVQDFGPISVGLNAENVPAGLEPQALISVASGKLAPLSVTPEGARFTAVTERTIEDSAEYKAIKAFSLLPAQNARLGSDIVHEWLHSAYKRYNIQLSQQIKTNQ